MVAVADARGSERFTAGGQSMGCATALYAGMEQPDRVQGMILMNPPTAWEARAANSASYRRLAKIGGLLGGSMLARIMGRNPERFLPGWLVNEIEAGVSGAVEGLKPMKRRTLSALFNGAALTDLPAMESLGQINVPALILGWTGDPTHPIATAKELNELLPQSTLVVARDYAEFQSWPKLIREFAAQAG